MFLLLPIGTSPAVIRQMESDVEKRTLCASAYNGSCQDIDSISNPSHMSADNFQDYQTIQDESANALEPAATEVDLPSPSKHASLCDSSNLIIQNASKNSDVFEKSNQSEGNLAVPCPYWAKCYKRGCEFDHPSDWHVCEIGDDCKVFDCKDTHSYRRKKSCRIGEQCSYSKCEYLHPSTRPRDCPEGKECQEWDCKNPHPRGRPTKCDYAEKCSVKQCRHLHPPNRTLCLDGAEYVKFLLHDIHLLNRIQHALQLAAGKFQ